MSSIRSHSTLVDYLKIHSISGDLDRLWSVILGCETKELVLCMYHGEFPFTNSYNLHEKGHVVGIRCRQHFCFSRRKLFGSTIVVSPALSALLFDVSATLEAISHQCLHISTTNNPFSCRTSWSNWLFDWLWLEWSRRDYREDKNSDGCRGIRDLQ